MASAVKADAERRTDATAATTGNFIAFSASLISED
jgi:hypothetical protein